MLVVVCLRFDFALLGYLWFLVALMFALVGVHLMLVFTCIDLILSFYLPVDSFGGCCGLDCFCVILGLYCLCLVAALI